MKKILLLLICVAAVSAVSAQTYKRNIMGIRGGLNITSFLWNQYSGEGIDRPAKMGWHLGFSEQIMVSKNAPLYLETGVYLSNKGGIWSESRTIAGVRYEESEKIGMTYMQIPLKINYHVHLDDFVIEPFIGVHYALGLWGRSVYKTDTGGDKDKDVEKLYEGDIFRRSDVGMSLGVGASWSAFYAALSWERGFLDLCKTEGIKARNASNFMLTVGYNF